MNNVAYKQQSSEVIVANDNKLSGFGHNEITVRLGMLANDAQIALGRIEKGEIDVIDGWLAYGAALNEGRMLHPGDREFGQWVSACVLSQLANAPLPDEQSAAMWAASYPEQFDEARAAGNARTVRGIYAKWNEISAERVASEERDRAEAARLEAEVKRRAEEDARRKEKEAKDEEDRKAAAERRAEAEKAAAEAEAKAKVAEKKATKAEKKADKVKAGNDSKDDVRGTTGSGENEWYTPAQYIELARTVMGTIDVDPASNPIAQRTVAAAEYYTEETNGLDKEWAGNVWCNPPYAQPAIAHFADKMVAEVANGNTKEAVMLTHNYTDTAWFQKLARAASAICFTRGRVRFESPTGEKASPTQGQAFFYFGNDAGRFVDVFRDTGFVVEVK